MAVFAFCLDLAELAVEPYRRPLFEPVGDSCEVAEAIRTSPRVDRGL